jgi:hypothetical protein
MPIWVLRRRVIGGGEGEEGGDGNLSEGSIVGSDSDTMMSSLGGVAGS